MAMQAHIVSNRFIAVEWIDMCMLPTLGSVCEVELCFETSAARVMPSKILIEHIHELATNVVN